ncbi:hypothetical protein AVEN_113811-1, partial [Araneus ventricosus]
MYEKTPSGFMACRRGYLRAGLGSGSSFYDTEARCPPNEKEVECINFCNTCEVDSVCLDMCIPGCDCQHGFLRNKLGKCVPRHQCQTLHAEQ